MASRETKFDAFISYRRSDGAAVAHWLRRQLQSFRVPPALRKAYGRPLKIYLDTAFERGTADFYEGTIRPNLLASRWLLVIATPDARLRPQGTEDWIQREVSEFAAGSNGRNVIAVRGAGDFNDPLPADLIQRFPRIEIVDLRGASRFSFLNPARSARLASEKLKLIAPLLDLPDEEMPRLRQEEERRQQTRLGGTSGAVTGVLAAVAGLSVWALQSQYRSQRTLDDGLFATSSMVVQSARLKAVPDTTEDRTRRILIAQGCDLIDKMRVGTAREPPIDGLVTCLVERAIARERVGEIDQAERSFVEAIADAEARHRKYQRNDAARAQLEANTRLIAFYDRQKRAQAADAERTRYLERLSQIQAAHPQDETYIDGEVEILGELGDHAVQGKDFASATRWYDQAARAIQRIANLPAASNPADTLYRQAQYDRRAATSSDAMNDEQGALDRFRLATAAIAAIAPGHASADALQEGAVSYSYIWDKERRAGDVAAAQEARQAALDLTEQVLADAKATASTRSLAEKLKQMLTSN